MSSKISGHYTLSCIVTMISPHLNEFCVYFLFSGILQLSVIFISVNILCQINKKFQSFFKVINSSLFVFLNNPRGCSPWKSTSLSLSKSWFFYVFCLVLTDLIRTNMLYMLPWDPILLIHINHVISNVSALTVCGTTTGLPPTNTEILLNSSVHDFLKKER